LTKLRLNLYSLKSAKILNTVQVFINSSYSVRQTLFYVLFTAQFRTARIFHQYKFLCTVPRNLVLLFYFPSTTVLCRITDFRTQACAVTLNPALVFNLGKLPVDAAIHALIFRQVNRILDLIQAQVTLRTHTKNSSRFLSRQTACWRSYPRTNL